MASDPTIPTVKMTGPAGNVIINTDMEDTYRAKGYVRIGEEQPKPKPAAPVSKKTAKIAKKAKADRAEAADAD